MLTEEDSEGFLRWLFKEAGWPKDKVIGVTLEDIKKGETG